VGQAEPVRELEFAFAFDAELLPLLRDNPVVFDMLLELENVPRLVPVDPKTAMILLLKNILLVHSKFCSVAIFAQSKYHKIIFFLVNNRPSYQDWIVFRPKRMLFRLRKMHK